ncbi:hypothetical protein RclHR1_24200001, partial [Rhizophagus clarus]
TYFSEKYWEWPWKIWKILGNGLKDFRNHQGTAWRPRVRIIRERLRDLKEQSWKSWKTPGNDLGDLRE